MLPRARSALFVAAALSLCGPAAATDVAALVQAQRLKAPRIEEVLDSLSLRPGMTALDVGAGTGQEAQALARRVGPRGTVFAADIDPALVAYLAGQARAQQLPIQAVRVSPEGFDPFYARQRYDLVLLWDTDLYLRDRARFYRGLAAQLKPGGRVVVVDSEPIPDRSFYPEDVKDWPGLLASIAREPNGSPWRENLAAPLRALELSRPSRALRQRLALFQLNRLMRSELFVQFSTGDELRAGLQFTPEERAQASWLLERLRLEGLPGDTEMPLWPVHDQGLAEMLNKLLLIQRLRPYLNAVPPQPYWSAAPEVRWYRDHDRRAAAFAAAGLTLREKRELAPYWAVWVFTR